MPPLDNLALGNFSIGNVGSIVLDDADKEFIIGNLLGQGEITLGNVGDLIIDVVRQRKRVFNYDTAFPALNPNCGSDFQRTFVHQDWIDGESVVQAETSSGEEGFNSRFHKIEADLESLGANVGEAFVCLAAMRADLRALLDEIREEINLINGDIYECCLRDKGTTFPTFPLPDLPILDRSEFVGATKYLDKDYFVYRNADRFVFVPKVEAPPDKFPPRNPLEDPRVKNPVDFRRTLEQRPEIAAAFNGRAITRKELIEKFGDIRVNDSATIADVVRILPQDASFANMAALNEALSARSALAIELLGGQEVVSDFFGVGTTVDSFDKVSVDKLSNIPPTANAALKKVGADTVAGLTASTPAELAAKLRKAGVDVSVADVAGWQAAASVLRKVPGRKP